MNLSGGMLEESSQRKITSEFLHLFELYYNHQVLATKWGFFFVFIYILATFCRNAEGSELYFNDVYVQLVVL